ncbi:MAG: sulfite exporter TauE/SafE family protein [Candidatus Aureabacteria bacterium]|nr:sulfite exporter TauE/SafE family protein [Candidatus Auribacterota bacterium]
MRIIIVSLVIFLLAIIMAMVGRGGGNFYVPVLIAAGASMNVAATSAQLILMITALVATFVFHAYKTVDWKLALIIDPPTDIMAFVGGYYAHFFSGCYLKILFSVLLALSAFFMFRPVKERAENGKRRFGYWTRSFNGYRYNVNLWMAIPVTAGVGFFAGMLGISGGSFKIPFMVLACGVPMRIAVGTSSAMVAVTALMGFTGHVVAGDFSYEWIFPLACVAVAAGFIGGKISVKVNPVRLKHIFAYSTLAASVFMIGNAVMTL